MKSKAVIPLVLGLAVGLLAVKYVVEAVQQAQGTPQRVVTAVVARTDIPASLEITADMVDTVQTPQTPLIPEDGFTDVEALIGRVTSKGVPKGAVVSPLFLAPPGTPAGLTERIPEGYRAVSVKIDEVAGVAYQLKPGDFVDVTVVMRVRKGNRDNTISRVILERVKVLAVGQNLGAADARGPQKLARSVTLLVTTARLPELHLAQTQGKLTLALRGADDRMMNESSMASTAQWDDSKPRIDPSTAVAMTPTRTLDLATPNSVTPPNLSDLFAVTVFNGPIRTDGGTAVQQVVYKNKESMKVVEIHTGRTTEGDPGGGESIVRQPRSVRSSNDPDRLFQRGGNRRPGQDQPQDREMIEE
ncbi:MAG: Flp pilus assembly protein CpaB [Phycisphaerae bacterium]